VDETTVVVETPVDVVVEGGARLLAVTGSNV
jgi:hypothetical protein